MLFNYPYGRKPGSISKHVANTIQNTAYLSVIAVNGGNFVDVNSGCKGTVSGGVTGGLKSYIGPYSRTNASFDKVSFPFTTSALKTITIAGILIPGTITGFNSFLSTSSLNGGFRLGTNGASFNLTEGAVLEIVSGINLAIGVPYFVAVSADTSKANFIVCNLLNGKREMSSINSSTATAGNGTLVIGSDFTNGAGLGSIACLMVSGGTGTDGRLSLPVLIDWALDPWSFWYPEQQSYNIAFQTSSFPWWTVQNNYPVLGTGTY